MMASAVGGIYISLQKSCKLYVPHRTHSYSAVMVISTARAGLRHVRGVRPNRAAKFRGAAISDLTKINLL